MSNAEAIIPPESVYRHKGMQYKLICEGVCVDCAHCGLKLTDAVSQERGLGPVCSKRGYADDVQVNDEIDALIALSEYPVLVEYLVKRYKSVGGNRALVNGLVRTASLNRRSPVHAACTDAIDMLGFRKLASVLRESLSSVEIKNSKSNPDCYEVWVKRSDFSWPWWSGLKNLNGVRMVRYPTKKTLVPKTHRRILAELTVKNYEGLFVKTDNGSFRISSDWLGRVAED